MDFDKLKAWLCLKHAPALKTKKLFALLEKWPDPMEFVGNPAHELYQDNELDAATRKHLADGLLPQNYIQIEKLVTLHQIRILCFTDEAYPFYLKQIFTPPLILYYRGDLINALRNKRLAVVGTRKPSSYGREMCVKTIAPACREGLCIVSGLAIGIDTVAHLTALDNGAYTLAILASGVENIYPPQNRDLANRIMAHGALVSEYDPGSRMERWNFPARNRIVSALSEATYVVEGPITSGALLTAKFAIEQNRELMALPGQINHTSAQGPNYLIKSGARLISCPEDILEAMDIKVKEDPQLTILPELSEGEQSVFELFQKEQRELSFDDLILLTRLSFGKLSIILLNLELKNYICKASGNSFMLR